MAVCRGSVCDERPFFDEGAFRIMGEDFEDVVVLDVEYLHM